MFEFEDWIIDDRPDRIDDRLLAHPRTLFSHHLGSDVTDTRRNANEIIRWSKGEPFRYQVN